MKCSVAYVIAPAVERHTMGKWQLFGLLAQQGCKVVTLGGLTGVVLGIGREDGSGSSFNVNLKTAHGVRTVYVRTMD